MRNYERSVRPVINATTPVIVQLGITLTQIFDLVCILFIYLSLHLVGIIFIIKSGQYSIIITSGQCSIYQYIWLV